MSFLAPLFLLGGLAVALPIIFHLIRRTPVVQRVFSSLMFLNPSPPQLSRRSRLDKILLLLLRCLIIGLVAFAFARPFLRGRVPNAGPGDAQKVSVFLVDTSASMRRDGVWVAAVARARELARQAAPGDRAQLAVFDHGTRRLLSFEEWSALQPHERAAAVEQRLNSVGPTWHASDLGTALISAGEELDGVTDVAAGVSKEIVVISDMQEGSRLQHLQEFEWPKNVHVSFVTIAVKNGNNAALHPAIEGPSTNRAETRPLVRISNGAESKREQFRLSWADARTGDPVGQAVDVQAVPGKTRSIRAPQQPRSAGDFRLVLSGDDETFDNSLFIATPEPEQVEVIFVGSAAENDPAGLYFYLRRAFQETQRRKVTLTRSTNNAALSPNAHFVVATDALSDGQSEALRKYIEAGHTALFVVNSLPAAKSLDRILQRQLEISEGIVKGYAMIEQIDFTHPIFVPFAEPRFSDFTKIHFWKMRQISTNGMADTSVLARFDNGAPALLEAGLGAGKLLVLASGWQPVDSQFALSTKFVPLLYSISEYAGGVTEHTTLVTVGAELPLKQGGTVQRLDGSAVPAEAGRWIADAPGLFKVSEGSKSYKVAVNLDPAESKTGSLDIDALRSMGVPLRAQAMRNLDQENRARKTAAAIEVESRQKLWRWLIIAALAFVLVETWFAARLSRPVLAET
jgi:hypothetical protein